MIVGETGTRAANVSTIDAFSGIGSKPESFEAVLNALAADSAIPSVSPHLGGNPDAQDSMAMMGWRDKLPFGRKQAGPSNEPLGDVVHGLARVLKDSANDSPEVKEAIDKLVRDLLGGNESEFSSLGHIASKVEHAVAGFGRTTAHYVTNHAEEIGLSAGGAAFVGGIAAGVVDVVGGVGAVAALF